MSADKQRAVLERAAARRGWPVRRLRLGEEPREDLSATTSAAARIRMMWPLACEAWSLARRPILRHERAAMPSRVVRPAAQGDRRDGRD